MIQIRLVKRNSIEEKLNCFSINLTIQSSGFRVIKPNEQTVINIKNFTTENHYPDGNMLIPNIYSYVKM